MSATNLLHPTNAPWVANLAGIENTSGPDRESFDAVMDFKHPDGRYLQITLTLALGGEVLVDGTRSATTPDGFTSTVDDGFDEELKHHDPDLVRRSFWAYDTQTTAAAIIADKDGISGTTIKTLDPEPADSFEYDFHYRGAWADFTAERISTHLTPSITGVMGNIKQFDDLEVIYSKAFNEGHAL